MTANYDGLSRGQILTFSEIPVVREITFTSQAMVGTASSGLALTSRSARSSAGGLMGTITMSKVDALSELAGVLVLVFALYYL